MIESLGGVTTTSQGTDLLKMNDGSTILLRSAAINLDDAKYAGKTVEVSGVLNYTTDGKQIMDVESIDIIEESISSTQAVATTWRDYINANLGFTVKYRDDFQVAESENMVIFKRNVSSAANSSMTQQNGTGGTMQIAPPHTLSIQVTSHAASETLIKNVLHLPSDGAGDLLAANVSRSKIGTDSIDAYKRVGTDDQSITFNFDAGGKFYEIKYIGGTDSQNLEDQNVFYDFLASFHLLNSQVQTQESDVLNNPVIHNPVTNNTSASQTTQQSSISNAINSSSENFVPPAPVSGESKVLPTSSTTSNSTVAGNTSVTSSVSSSSSGTQETLAGYSLFTSTGYKFSLQYPKNWYYGSAPSSDTSVIRHYDFGTKPVDEQPGIVSLDLVSGSIPGGSTINVDGKTVTRYTENSVLSLYYKGANGRIYRISGPFSTESDLMTMVKTLQE
jgi:hypothetical protein